MNDQVHTIGDVQSGGAVAIQKDRAMAMAQEVLSPFSSMVSFTATKAMAEILVGSKFVPDRFREKLGDCMIALGIASRMGADPIMVMQNLYVVKGQPAWSGQFVIACINQSGQFRDPLHFVEVGTRGQDDWGFYAEAISKAGTLIKGPTVDIALAKAEGWMPVNDPATGKLRRVNGKLVGNIKWLNLPEMMLRYRAGSWFGRTECPEVMMGFLSRGEVDDANVITIDPETGDIIDPGKKKPETVSIGAVVDSPKVTAAPKEPIDVKPEKETVKQTQGPAAEADWQGSHSGDGPQTSELSGDRFRDLKNHNYYQDAGRYFNRHGEMWDPNKHATAKATQGPVVNADGHFRARRKVTAAQDAPNPQAGQGAQLPSGAADDPAAGATQAGQQAADDPDPIPDNPNHPGQQPAAGDGGWE